MTKKRTVREYSADLLQDGAIVASVVAESREDVIRYITHYALMFLKDGPVMIRHNGTRVRNRT